MSIVLPPRAVDELARIADDTDTVIELRIAEERGQLLWQARDAQLWSQIMPGNFPMWSAMASQKYDTRLVVDRASFLYRLRLAEPLARSHHDLVHLTLTPGNIESGPGYLAISVDTPKGRNYSHLRTSVTGRYHQITFNFRYLREALSAIHTPRVILELQEASSMGVLRPVDDLSEVEDEFHLVARVYI